MAPSEEGRICWIPRVAWVESVQGKCKERCVFITESRWGVLLGRRAVLGGEAEQEQQSCCGSIAQQETPHMANQQQVVLESLPKPNATG